MTRKSFTGYVREGDPLDFDVNGQVFRCIPVLPGTKVLDFTAGMDENNPAKMAEVLTELLDFCIVPEQLDEWHAFADDPKNGVGFELLSEIAGYLLEEYVGRPLSSSDKSSDGPVPVGPLQTAQPS